MTVVLVKICEFKWKTGDGVERECAEPKGHEGPHRTLEERTGSGSYLSYWLFWEPEKR